MGGGPFDPMSDTSDYYMVSLAETEKLGLLYSKSKVYVYRSSDEGDRIPGFLCIVQGSVPRKHYIAWTPEALLPEKDRESYVQVELYPNFADPHDSTAQSIQSQLQSLALDDTSSDHLVLISSTPLQPSSCTAATSYAFCEPLDDVASLLVQPPSFSQWYGSVIVTLRSGTALPPLWFHDDESASAIVGQTRHWGGDELIAQLIALVEVKVSERNPRLYLINGSSAPDTLDTDEAQQHAHLCSTPLSPSSAAEGGQGGPRISGNRSGQPPLSAAMIPDMKPLVKQAKEWQWNVLEQFSRITRTFRDATMTIQENPIGRSLIPMLPMALRPLQPSNHIAQMGGEYESARLYLARWAAQHISRRQREESAGHPDSEYQREGRGAKDTGRSGDSSSVRVWEEWMGERSELGSFEVISTDRTARLPEPLQGEARPLSAEQWFSFFQSKHDGPDVGERLQADKDQVLRAIFAGGVEEDIRPVVWKYLLGMYPWDSTEAERRAIDAQKHDEYWRIKASWVSDIDRKTSRSHIEQASRIDKDVLRTDRTVPIFAESEASDTAVTTAGGLPGSNSSLEQMKDILLTYHYHDKAELGYVQGMSDLLAPIYAVMQDEPNTFWCFAKFMERMRRNFVRNQSGMRAQLDLMRDLVRVTNPQLYQHLDKTDSTNMFFCFRWLLIWFKREFTFEESQHLWEVLWTDYLTDQFVLFVALAILQQHADVIIDHLRRFDEILKYINDLAETINLDTALRDAEMWFYKLQYCIDRVQEQRRQEVPDAGCDNCNDEVRAKVKAKDTQP
ncbi:GTPase activating protein, partial [Spiromyces aspiralis]